MVDSAIPEIVALALDDKNSEIWTPAIRLLILLSSPPKGGQVVAKVSDETSTPDYRNSNSGRTTSYNFALSQIKSHMVKFMALLDSESEGRASLVVELLSSVSIDKEGQSLSQLFSSVGRSSQGHLARRKISLRIASKVPARAGTKQEGHIQLLSRLISDGEW
jgi:hypothetical protein